MPKHATLSTDQASWPWASILLLGTFGPQSPGGRRYQRRTVLALAALVILLPVPLFAAAAMDVAAVRWLAPAVVAVAMAFISWEMWRYVAGLDELSQAVQRTPPELAIADDSGLEVDYLRGAPGIHSARYSGGGDSAKNDKLLAALEGVPAPERSARYQCLLVYLRHELDPTPLICQGSWEGRILTSPRGSGGFGYDPPFVVSEAAGRAMAELSEAEKNAISHRGRAVLAMRPLLLDAINARLDEAERVTGGY